MGDALSWPAGLTAGDDGRLEFDAVGNLFVRIGNDTITVTATTSRVTDHDRGTTSWVTTAHGDDR
jgi:hypothetical protein